MKIYRGKIGAMAVEIARQLVAQEAVEVEDADMSEFRMDIEAVLRSYVDTERQVYDEAQEIISRRGMDFESLGRIRREVARKYNFGLGDDCVDWITEQIIEVLYHTDHVVEVWEDNGGLRRIMRPVIEKYASIDDELDAEVRQKIKNLSEGSTAWDVRYRQVMDELKRRKGLQS